MRRKGEREREMEMRKLAPRARARSLMCALRGVGIVLRSQPNGWIMVVAGVCTIAAGFLLEVSTGEWCLLLIAVFVVLVAELFNTAIEFLTDLVAPEYHPLAGKAKDAAAGAVLLASVLAFLIGLVILAPKMAAVLR